MVEPTDAKELIEDAVEEFERANEKDRNEEKKFRDGVSILVGLFAVLLAVIHVEAAGSARQSVLKTIQASDNYNYMQAKIIREAVMKSAAQNSSYDRAARANLLKEASRLRNPDAAGHGIVQLQRTADNLREEGEISSDRGEWFEFGETALQVAIVLLSIALVARSRAIVGGAIGLAALGILLSVGTSAGLL